VRLKHGDDYLEKHFYCVIYKYKKEKKEDMTHLILQKIYRKKERKETTRIRESTMIKYKILAKIKKKVVWYNEI
jgi:hypothetical protein